MERKTIKKPSNVYRNSSLRFKKFDDSEKTLPEKLERSIPESQLFLQLVDFERKLDATLISKRLSIDDASKISYNKNQGDLEIIVSNTFKNQKPFYHTDSVSGTISTDPPSWILRIEGRLLNGVNYGRKFTEFFKSIFIQFEQTQHSGDLSSTTIEWHKTSQSVSTDGFELKRPGDNEITLKIIMHLDYPLSHFRLSPALSTILDLKFDTKAGIIRALWQYVRLNRLHEPNDRRVILNNAPLKEVFGCDKMHFSQVPQLLLPHLLPPEPIEINYRIRLSDDSDEPRQCFTVQIPLSVASEINQSNENFSQSKQITLLDEQVERCIEQIHLRKRKRDFMLAFSNDPIQFIHNFLASQIHDYKVINSQNGKDEEQERKSRFYFQPYVYDAVQSYLQSLAGPQER